MPLHVRNLCWKTCDYDLLVGPGSHPKTCEYCDSERDSHQPVNITLLSMVLLWKPKSCLDKEQCQTLDWHMYRCRCAKRGNLSLSESPSSAGST